MLSDGQVPDGWRVVRLKEILKLEYGFSLPERRRRPGGIPVIGSAGVVGSHNISTVEGPGIVVGRKGSIGKVTWIDEDFVPIDTTYFTKLNNKRVDMRWVFYLLLREDLSKLNRATGIPGLNRDDVYALRRPLPPLTEQRAIAGVLDAIDEAIERTEAVIAATERLRDSLLHELLTRGLPGWHREWKEVAGVGTVPACWEVMRLGEVAEVTMGNSPPGKDCNRTGRGVPLLNGPTEFSRDHPVPAQWTSAPRKLACRGDLLFCVRGATAGRMNWANRDYAIGRGVAALRHNSGFQYQNYLSALIEHGLPRLLHTVTGVNISELKL